MPENENLRLSIFQKEKVILLGIALYFKGIENKGYGL